MKIREPIGEKCLAQVLKLYNTYNIKLLFEATFVMAFAGEFRIGELVPDNNKGGSALQDSVVSISPKGGKGVYVVLKRRDNGLAIKSGGSSLF